MNINYEALKESAKEVLRWVALFIVSWIVTETLRQLDLVPESYNLHVWVFTYYIPVRLLFNVTLTFIGRAVDKYIHELGVQKKEVTNQDNNLIGGLTRF